MLSQPDFKEKQVIFVFLSYGEKLSFKNSNIIITDKDKKIKHQSSCYRLFALFVVGHLTITTGLIQRAKRFGFSIVFMTHSLKPYAYWNASAQGNVLLRAKQYSYKSLDIAKKLIQNKIHNQIKVLQKIRNKDERIKASITSLLSYKNSIMKQNIELHSILGFEGMASKVYFQTLYRDYRWMARRPRTKMDMTNTLLDIGYTLLFNFIEGLVNLYGFDTYQGVYHKQFYQRKSLICDLVEPFRPLIDSRIRKAYGLNQIKKEDFIISKKQFFLFGKKSLPYLKFLIENLETYKEIMFLYIQAYYRSFIRNEPIEKYPFFNIDKDQKAS